MEVSNRDLKLSELEEGKWYFLENHERTQWYAFTGINIEDDWIYIRFIVDELEETELEKPYDLRFKYSQEGLNEIFQYYFSKDYIHPLDKNADDLNWIDRILQACLF